MNTRIGQWLELTLPEKLPVSVETFPLGHAFVTEIQTETGGCVVARGIAETAKDSLDKARQVFSKRVLYNRCLDLTVGG